MLYKLAQISKKTKLCLVLCLLVGLSIQSFKVWAQEPVECPDGTYMTPEQKRLFDSGVIYYDICNIEAPDPVAIPGGPLVGCNNAEIAWNFFKGKSDDLPEGQRLSDEQIAGILGNLAWESGINPLRVQGTPTPSGDSPDPNRSNGWGLMQWTPGSKTPGLMQRASITTPVSELGSQLELVWWHLRFTSPTGRTDVISGYRNQTSVEAATIYFERNMEGAGFLAHEQRIALARGYLNAASTGEWCT